MGVPSTAMPQLGGGQNPPLVIMLAKNVGPASTLICAQNRGRIQRTGENFIEAFPTPGILYFVPRRCSQIWLRLEASDGRCKSGSG